ncbi:MAG: YdeI/OmpD-associated family protein [Ancrocorticia sp.]
MSASARPTPSPISFETTLDVVADRAIIRLPREASAALPSRGQVAVGGTMNGIAFETVVEPDGARGHWISLNDDLRERLGLAAGDAVTVTITPRAQWPEPELPEDFEAALAAATDLTDTWSSITPMARWEWVRWVNATRNADTRERRVSR